jgi:hypothetical protein
MTEAEFKSEMALLLKQHDTAVYQLQTKFAIANNTVKVGDIIEDHVGKILVESIRVVRCHDLPMCRYFGLPLLKNGKPSKKPSNRVVSQSNLKGVNNGKVDK